MLIKRKSLISGIEREREIDVTEEQLAAWRNGMLAQDAMPHLSASDREFVMTGITDEEWDTLAPPDDEEGGDDDDAPFD